MLFSTSRATLLGGIAAGLVSLLAMPQAHAQRFTFQLYGQAEGLTNLTPLSMLQDHTGFLWVGTQNGLFRYDGSRFERFTIDQGLPANHIDSLYEVPHGAVLAATPAGIATFVNNRFEVKFAGLTTKRREGIAAAPGDYLYVATDSGLVVAKGSATQTITTGPDPKIASVFRDSQNVIWVGCGQRLCNVRGETLATVNDELPPDRWFSIREDCNRNLWVLGSQSVWVRRTGKSQFEALPPLPMKSAPFLGDPDLEADFSGKVVVTSPSGLYRWDTHKWKVVDTAAGLLSATIFRRSSRIAKVRCGWASSEWVSRDGSVSANGRVGRRPRVCPTK